MFKERDAEQYTLGAGPPLAILPTCLAAMSGVMGAGAESNTMPSMRPMQLLAALEGAAGDPSACAGLEPLSLCSCSAAAASVPPHLPEAMAGWALLLWPCSAASRSSVPRNMNPALLQQAGCQSRALRHMQQGIRYD